MPALDGIRGIAILAVCVFHFTLGLETGIPAQILGCGIYGVDLFFVLSGFLITGILLDSRWATNHFTAFYARRSLRIFPLYFVFLAVTFGALAWFHRAGPEGSRWWYVMYAANWKPNHTHGDAYVSHLWSLAIEEQFYIVWPLIVWLAGARKLRAVCIALAFTALALRFFLPTVGVGYEAIYRGTFTRMDTLVLGALMAVVARNSAWSTRVRSASVPLMIGAALAWLLAVAIQGSPARSGIVETVGSSALAVLFCLWVFRASTASSRSPLAAGWLSSIGTRAYGIYVIHAPLAGITNKRMEGHAGFAPMALYVVTMIGVSYCLAWVSFRFFETPINRRKRRFPYKSAALGELAAR